MKSWLLAVALAGVIGCGGDETEDAAAAAPSPYDALYSVTPSTADATKLEGLWETTVNTNGATLLARVQFKDGTIQFASRCSGEGYQTVTVGVTVNATWNDTKINVPDAGGAEQKTSASSTGKPAFVCIAQLKGPGTSPYTIADSKLQTLGYTFTKVTD